MLRTFAAAAILALTATAAQAETAQVSVNVAFGDLNLSRPADAKILADRLRTAAGKVCGDISNAKYANGATWPGAREETQECMRSAINLAIARIEGRLDNIVRGTLTDSNRPAATPELVNAQN